MLYHAVNAVDVRGGTFIPAPGNGREEELDGEGGIIPLEVEVKVVRRVLYVGMSYPSLIQRCVH